MTLRNLITSIKVVKKFPNLTWLPNFLQHWYCNHIILQKYLKSHNILSRQIWALIFFLFISASFFRQIVWEIEIIWDQYFFSFIHKLQDWSSKCIAIWLQLFLQHTKSCSSNKNHLIWILSISVFFVFLDDKFVFSLEHQNHYQDFYEI